MKRRGFERLHRVRELAERSARDRFGCVERERLAALDAAVQARRFVALALDDVDRAQAALDLSPPSVIAATSTIEPLLGMARSRDAASAERDRAAEQARLDWMAAKSARRALEVLAEREREAHAERDRRREERDRSEFVDARQARERSHNGEARFPQDPTLEALG